MRRIRVIKPFGIDNGPGWLNPEYTVNERGYLEMSLFSEFKTNKSAEIEGVEVPYSKNDDGTIPTFRIARMGRSNSNYRKTLERETRPFRRQMELETLSNEMADEITLKVFVSSILLGWNNVQDENGQEIPFNQENAIALMRNLPDLYDDLSNKASKASLFRDAMMERDSKNS
jgi:hypothetical protein